LAVLRAAGAQHAYEWAVRFPRGLQRRVRSSGRPRGLRRQVGRPAAAVSDQFGGEVREEDQWSGGAYAAMFDNSTILDATASLVAASKATAAGSKYRFRISQALMAVQFVIFYRWVELQAYAEAKGRPWLLAATIAEEFDHFAMAMNASGLKGGPITSITAALAPNGTANAGREVSVAQLREQVLAHAQQ
jgi:hypothetical protein